MKKTILLFVFLLSAFYKTNAAVYTVSNNAALPGSPGQYTTVTAAMAVASNGDTILIQPSATTYGTFTITKELTVIGAGYYPQTSSGLKSEVGSVNFGNGSSNSKLVGLYCYDVNMSNTFAVSNYTVSRCFCAAGLNFNGGSPKPSGTIVVENCILSTGYLSFSSNASQNIRNNLFITGNGIYLGGTSTSTIDYVRNNTFLCGGTPLIDMMNDVIENNIFYSNFPNTSNTTNTFNNNYVFGSSTLPFGTNVGSGNITNTNPTWDVFTCGMGLGSIPVVASFNWRPVASSVVINGGTNGTDIGITGGVAPFYRYPAPYPMTGEPQGPQVREVTIPVSSVPAGGTLNINVKARKRD